MTQETSTDVFNMVESIAALSGKAQQTRIGECMDESEFFVEVCKRALDPFVTYGIKQVPSPDTTGPENFSESTLVLLDMLAGRELTGNAAKEAITMEMSALNEESQILLERIIKKDLRAKFSAKSLNRHVPGTVFIFDCMLAHKFDEKRITVWPVAVEPKYDGVRSLGIYKGGQVKFYSRTGKEFLNYQHIADQLADMMQSTELSGTEFVFDGEMMDGEFLNTVGTAKRKGEQAVNTEYVLFEAMTLESFEDGNPHGYVKRRKFLDALMRRRNDYHTHFYPAPSNLHHSMEGVIKMNDEIQAVGGEGVIVKPLAGLYARKRSHDWLKIKANDSVDVRVIGAFFGTGKFAETVGGIIVDLDGVNVSVGSGLTDADRDHIHGLWESDDNCGQETLLLPMGREMNLYGRMVKVSYHEKTPDGSLRHPVFQGFRDDKPHHDGVGV